MIDTINNNTNANDVILFRFTILYLDVFSVFCFLQASTASTASTVSHEGFNEGFNEDYFQVSIFCLYQMID